MTETTPRTPKTCKRCKGTGFVTFTDYAGGFCMGCGGSGIKENKPGRVQSASVEGPFGGSDGHVTVWFRAADHRDAAWSVSVYSSLLFDQDAHIDFATEAEARTHANVAYKALKAACAAERANR